MPTPSSASEKVTCFSSSGADIAKKEHASPTRFLKRVRLRAVRERALAFARGRALEARGVRASK